MTFRHGKYWWTRVPTSAGRPVRRSLQTTNHARAKEMERMIGSWRDQGRWLLVDALASGELTPARAFEAYQSAAADQLAESIVRERAAAKAVDVAGPDMRDRIPAWVKVLSARGRRDDTVIAYERQVRALLGDAPVRAGDLNRKWIRDRLGAVGVAQTNRYRSALSAFCAWLVDEDVIEQNPVRDVRRIAESAPRDRHLVRADVLKLLGAIPEPYRALNALMGGTGMEISAALALTHGDIDRERRTVRARGTKRRHRDRTVKFFKRWLPEWEMLLAHVDAHPGVGDALVFPGIDRRRAYQVLVESCAACSVTDYTQHDWRHSYAVQATRDRMPEYLIAQQLGHANETMVRLVYGKFRVAGEDLEAWAETENQQKTLSVVTPDVTQTRARVGAKRGR